MSDAAAPSWGTTLTDGAVAAVAGTCAMVSFGSAYGGQRYLLVGVAGLVAGVAVAAVGARRRLHPLWTVAGALLAYFVLGGPLAAPSASIARVVPSPAGVHDLAVTAVTGWAGLLATSPVIGNAGHLLAVPLLCGVLCGSVTVILAGRFRGSPLVMVPPFSLLALGIVFGTAAPPAWLALDAVLAALLLGWAAWRSRAARPEGIASTARNRPVAGASLLVASAGLGLVIGPLLPGSTSHLRYVLRDHIPPPFNVHAYPSPLAAYRNYVLPAKEGGDALFRVSGAPAGSYLRIATMDAYDGVVFEVAPGAPGSSTSGDFATVGDPVSSQPCPSTCTQATVHVQLLHYQNVWLPDVGTVRSVAFGGVAEQSLRNAFRYNVSTDAAVVSTGVGAPESYTMVTSVPDQPPATAMANARAAQVSLPTVTSVPKVVQTQARALTRGKSGAFAQADALSSWLHANGAYSDGSNTQPPSLPGHSAYRIAQFLTGQAAGDTSQGGVGQPVGDAEQYAAAMDLMARSLGLPARVVLGVRLQPGTHTYIGKDVTAWVEVDFAGVGWYPFFPTPPVNATTRSTPPPPAPSSSQQAQYQPPTSNRAGSGAVPANASAASLGHPHHRSIAHDIWVVVSDAVVALVVLAILAGPWLTVMWLKARRRRRRRTAPSVVARMEGGWAEVVDRARDVGRSPPPHATRRQAAAVVGGSSFQVAEHADRASFGPGDPAPAEADALWANVDAVLAELEEGLPRWVRLRARVDPRSLMGGRVDLRRVISSLREVGR